MVKYNIRTSRLDEALGAIGKINKKAEKLKLTPINCKIGEPFVEDGIVFTPIEISVEIVKIAGWNFRATVECVINDGNKSENIISGPEAGRFAEYRNAENGCDHCKVSRYRKLTYIIEHDDGRIKQVGSTCLKDYLGHDPKRAISAMQFAKSIDECMEELYYCGRGGIDALPLNEVIITTLACIRQDGCYIKSGNGDRATWEKVWEALIDRRIDTKIHVTEEDIKRADLVKAEFKKTYDKVMGLANHAEAGDFEYKIYLMVKLNKVIEKPKHFAFAVGATAGTNYRLIRIEEDAKKAKKGEVNYFGELKKRDMFEIEIEKVFFGDGNWGEWVCLKGVQKDTNNTFVWFTNNNTVSKFVDDNNKPYETSYKIKATVKDHKEDPKYGKSTVLTRVSLV